MIRSFPFTGETYFSLFEIYNDTIWPAQVVAYLLGLSVLFLALRPTPAGERIALAVLSLFWLWNGLVYHLVFFLQINFAALPFGACCAAGFAAGRQRGSRWAPAAFRARCHQLGRPCLRAVRAGRLSPAGLGRGCGWPRAAMFGVARPRWSSSPSASC
jgi:hypothetical protein